MANINVMFSKNTDDWKTPTALYEIMMEKGYLDPCPYQSKENGLEKDFIAKKLFINPPFSTMKDWVKYGIKQYYVNHCEVIYLIPARTDTKYFHELLYYHPEIIFIKGRLHYNDSKTGAPFPSLLIRLTYKRQHSFTDYYSLDLERIIYLIKDNKLWQNKDTI